MRINDRSLAEKIAAAMSDPNVRRIMSATLVQAKSATELSEELTTPLRTIYRLIEDMCGVGLLTGERSALIESGGRYTLYRSMVRSVTVEFEGGTLNVDLIPNEDVIGKFMRLWSYMGQHGKPRTSGSVP